MTTVAWLWFAGVGLASPTEKLRFPGWFSDHMVLQRDRPIPVWGWAEPGHNVKVCLGGKTQTAQADETGRWQVHFTPCSTGGPFVLSAEDEATKSTICLSDVLIGDVWIISGQSNMEIPVKHGAGAEETIKTSQDDKLRLVHILPRPAYQPQADVKGQWLPATPSDVPAFSCVGYAFGRKLREELKDVPIGLIQAPVGSTVAETWLSRADIDRNKALAHYAAALDTTMKKFPQIPATKTSWLDPRKVPTVMYNGMIHPLLPYSIRGVIWWQGLANSIPVKRAYEYRQLFPYLIQCWRKEWGRENLPFIFAQEPTLRWPSHMPGFLLIREAQLWTAQEVPNTAMIVNSDLRNDADPTLIHFPQKPPVGYRMALAALAIEYKKPIVYCGPLYDSRKTRIEGAKMRIGFTHAESGLATRKGSLEDFVIAGEDQKFVRAHAEIDGKTIVVWADEVTHPKAVRYDWDDWTGATLINKDGFAASPFRTDDWPIRDTKVRRPKSKSK